jgi:DNA-binding IclR family transcriptional regulator
MNQSVNRALDILVALQSGANTLDELAARLEVHKSTVLRMLQTMEADRFVTHDERHRYILGSRLFELANSALAQRDVRVVARPHLERLNAWSGQTVHLATFESGEVVYVDKLEALQGVRMYSRVGLRAPLHCTAVAKVLVAALPEAMREEIARGIDYQRLTENTISSPAEYLAELTRVRIDGFARDHEEHEPFINCIAAPVRDGTGAVVAAASLSVPTLTWDAEHVFSLAPELIRSTREISADLGWGTDAEPGAAMPAA